MRLGRQLNGDLSGLVLGRGFQWGVVGLRRLHRHCSPERRIETASPRSRLWQLANVPRTSIRGAIDAHLSAVVTLGSAR